MIKKHELKNNDLLIVTTGDCGLSTIFKKQDFPYIPSAYIVRYRLNDKVLPLFIKYFFDSNFANKQVKSFIRRGTVENLPGSDVLKIKVYLPPLKEQQKIAEILSTWDDAIALTNSLIKAKQKLKRGLMQTTFDQCDDNQSVKLSVLVESHSYGPRFNAKNYNINGNVKTIRNTDIKKSGDILYNQVPIALLEDEMIKKHKLQDNDLLIVTTGDCGLSTIFEKQDFPYIPSAYIVRYRLNNKVLPLFIKYFFDSNFANKQVKSFIRKGTVENLPGSDVLKIRVFKPSLEEQKKIVDLFQNLDKEINLLQKKCNHLQKQKRGLMQKLLTGEWRVKIEEKSS